MAEAEVDLLIVAVTGAMPSGTGLDAFAKRFPRRTFDVGIAEQHAVTFAAGMADRRHEAFLRDLFDVPAARIRPGGARCCAAEAAGALCAGSCRIGRRGGRDAYRRLRYRLSGLPSRHGADGGRRRSGTDAYGGNGDCDRRPALRLPLCTRRRAWVSVVGAGHAARALGARVSCGKARVWRSCPTVPACRSA